MVPRADIGRLLWNAVPEQRLSLQYHEGTRIDHAPEAYRGMDARRFNAGSVQARLSHYAVAITPVAFMIESARTASARKKATTYNRLRKRRA
jgi:hypothetical protein